MTYYAELDAGNNVISYLDAAEPPIAPDGGSVKPIPAPPGPGRWTMPADVLVAYVPTLADNQAAKIGAAAAHYGALIAAGFTVSGVLYQTDPDSQSNIASMAIMALGSIANPTLNTWPAGFYWVAANNSQNPMDAPTMYAFGRAVANYVSASILNLRVIKNAILAAPDQPTLDAIDVTAGYPTASA